MWHSEEEQDPVMVDCSLQSSGCIHLGYTHPATSKIAPVLVAFGKSTLGAQGLLASLCTPQDRTAAVCPEATCSFSLRRHHNLTLQSLPRIFFFSLTSMGKKEAFPCAIHSVPQVRVTNFISSLPLKWVVCSPSRLFHDPVPDLAMSQKTWRC